MSDTNASNHSSCFLCMIVTTSSHRFTRDIHWNSPHSLKPSAAGAYQGRQMYHSFSSEPSRPGPLLRGCPTPIFNTPLLWLATRSARLRSFSTQKVSFPRVKNLARTLPPCEESRRTHNPWPGSPVTQCNTKRPRVNNAVAPSGD